MESPLAEIPAKSECDILSQESSPLKMGHKMQQYTRKPAQASILSLKRLLVPIGPQEEGDVPVVVLEPRSDGIEQRE